MLKVVFLVLPAAMPQAKPRGIMGKHGVMKYFTTPLPSDGAACVPPYANQYNPIQHATLAQEVLWAEPVKYTFTDLNLT